MAGRQGRYPIVSKQPLEGCACRSAFGALLPVPSERFRRRPLGLRTGPAHKAGCSASAPPCLHHIIFWDRCNGPHKRSAGADLRNEHAVLVCLARTANDQCRRQRHMSCRAALRCPPRCRSTGPPTSGPSSLVTVPASAIEAGPVGVKSRPKRDSIGGYRYHYQPCLTCENWFQRYRSGSSGATTFDLRLFDQRPAGVVVLAGPLHQL